MAVIGEVDSARAQAAALFPERICRKTDWGWLHASGETIAATPSDFLEAGMPRRDETVILDSPREIEDEFIRRG